MGDASTLDALRERLKARAGAAFDVVGVGECSLDEVWRLEGPLTPGGKARAAGRELLGGGQVATAMVACARLGLRAAWAGAIGDDEAGRQVLAGLREEEVDVSAAHLVPGGATRTALVIVDRAGERTVIEQIDRRVCLPHGDLAATPAGARLSGARVVHLDGAHPQQSLAAARLAGELGALVSVDLDHPYPGIDELLQLTDLCFTSGGLPQLLSGRDDLQAALLDLRARLRPGALVGCTLGAAGAAALDGDTLLLSPALPVEVVDTTACGDTFHAAALCALLDGRSLPSLLAFANAAAALKCRALGRRGCPRKPAVLAALASV